MTAFEIIKNQAYDIAKEATVFSVDYHEWAAEKLKDCAHGETIVAVVDVAVFYFGSQIQAAVIAFFNGVSALSNGYKAAIHFKATEGEDREKFLIAKQKFLECGRDTVVNVINFMILKHPLVAFGEGLAFAVIYSPTLYQKHVVPLKNYLN